VVGIDRAGESEDVARKLALDGNAHNGPHFQEDVDDDER
jgi:hypothetical protein